jgi:hypothetical protein
LYNQNKKQNKKLKETGIDGLEATRKWLRRAHTRIKSDETIGSFKYESGTTPSSIANEAFMEIFVWKSEYTFPEVSEKPV